MDILDVVGLHFVITRLLGKTDLKFLVAALGWTSAELIVTKLVLFFVQNFDPMLRFLFHRFLPLWVGARGIEFDWKYIQMSLDSNVALVRFRGREERKENSDSSILDSSCISCNAHLASYS